MRGSCVSRKETANEEAPGGVELGIGMGAYEDAGKVCGKDTTDKQHHDTTKSTSLHTLSTPTGSCPVSTRRTPLFTPPQHSGRSRQGDRLRSTLLVRRAQTAWPRAGIRWVTPSTACTGRRQRASQSHCSSVLRTTRPHDGQEQLLCRARLQKRAATTLSRTPLLRCI